MMAALRKHGEQLPEEVKGLLKDMTVKDGRQHTKDLHNAVKSLGQARKELQTAADKRLELHAAWQAYLTEALVRWEGWTKDFMTQDQAMQERLTLARDQLKNARANLDELRKDGNTTVDVDEDDEDMDIKADPGNVITENLHLMNQALSDLKSKATAM